MTFELKPISKDSVAVALQKAEGRRPAGNDEAILRWNTCVRLLARHEHLRPRAEEPVELSLE